jgi:hypothetical protein
MIYKYFRKKTDNFHFKSEIADIISESFRFFYSNHDPTSVISLLKPDGFKYIGFGINKRGQLIYFGNFLEVEEMKTQLTFDWEDYVKKFQLLKIGYNEYSEGGIYMGLNDENFGQIFHYKNHLEIAENEEIIKIANSFDEFMENAEVYGVNFDENGNSIYTMLKIDVPKSLVE